MTILTAYSQSIRDALTKANEHLHGNLRFKTCEHVKTRRDGRYEFSVTLTVNDSNEIGSRRSIAGHRISAACWHAHGLFFDALPAGTEIRTGNVKMLAGEKWQDYNIGSRSYPMQASLACNCMEWNSSGILPFPVNT